MANILSLFDGHRCGAMALQKAGIKIDLYLASEIDKHAIQAARSVYGAGVDMGTVLHVNAKMLPRIDYLLGGSPCQGFSFSGKQAGTTAVLHGQEIFVTSLVVYLELKRLGAEFLSQSALFWEYIRILAEVREKNPDVKFLLENVKMKKMYLDLISDALGVQPILINSNLVSAQNRPRYYWTNIKGVKLPEDKGVKLNDILEREVDEKYLISDSYLNRVNTSEDVKKMFTVLDPDKAICMTARQYANWKGTLVTAAGSPSPSRDGWVFVGGLEKGRRLADGMCLSRNYREGSRVYSPEGKAACLSASSKGGTGGATGLYGYTMLKYRKLTPRECGRLQTVPEHHIHSMLNCSVSDTQLYKMFGNGWTIDVIAGILSSDISD